MGLKEFLKSPAKAGAKAGKAAKKKDKTRKEQNKARLLKAAKATGVTKEAITEGKVVKTGKKIDFQSRSSEDLQELANSGDPLISRQAKKELLKRASRRGGL